MSRCRHYISSTLYIIKEREREKKAALKWLGCCLCFLKAPYPLSSPDLWFLKSTVTLRGKNTWIFITAPPLRGAHPQANAWRIDFFSKCILDFICRLHFFLFSPSEYTSSPLPCNTHPHPLCFVPHQYICMEIIPGVRDVHRAFRSYLSGMTLL